MCGITTTIGYDVDPHLLGEMCAGGHEKVGSRGKGGSGFHGVSPFNSVQFTSTGEPHADQVLRILSEFLDMDQRIVSEATGSSHGRWDTGKKKKKVIPANNALQPHSRDKGDLVSTILYNGHNSNHLELAKKYKSDRELLDTVGLHSLLRKLLYSKNKKNQKNGSEGLLVDEVKYAVKKLMKNADGSHAMIWHVADHIRSEVAHFAFRAPNGNRPLCYGGNKEGNIFGVASESHLLAPDLDFIDFVKPGELIEITRDGIKKHQLVEGNEELCALDLLYLMNRESWVMTKHGPKQVWEIHENLGRLLWGVVKERWPDVKFDHIGGVPNGGLDFAAGFEKAAGIYDPDKQQLIERNKDARSYTAETRAEAIAIIVEKFKLNSIHDIKRKKVLVIDDTIVKGDTMIHGITPLLREFGADVYTAIPAPAIRHGDDRGAVIREETLAGRFPDGSMRTDDEIFELVQGNNQGVFLPLDKLIEGSMMNGLHTRMFERAA